MIFFCIFITLKLRLSSSLPTTLFNLSDVFKQPYHKDYGTDFDYELVITESPPSYNSSFSLLCSQHAGTFQALTIFENSLINNSSIFITPFPGAKYLSSIFRGRISNSPSQAKYLITDNPTNKKSDYFNIEIKNLPFDLSSILQKSFPIFITGDTELLQILSCSPSVLILDFHFLCYLLIFSYLVVLVIANRRQPKRFYTLTKEKEKASLPIGIVDGLTIHFNGEIIRKIIRGINIKVPFDIDVTDQHFVDTLNLGDSNPTPTTYFEPGTNDAVVKTPIIVGNDTIETIISRDKNKNVIFDPLMTAFCHLYLQCSLHSILLSSSYGSIIDFVQYLCKTFDLKALFFYKCVENNFELLFHEDRSGNKCQIDIEDLKKVPKLSLFEKSEVITKNGYKFFISRTELSHQSFTMVIGIEEGVVQIMGIEDYFRRFFVLTLSFWYFTTVQSSNEVSCKNYLSMIRSSHAFTVAEYFEDMTELSTVGELENGESLFSFFTEEQDRKFKDDLTRLRQTGVPFSQQQYRVTVHGNVKWFSVSGQMSFDSYYNRNVVFCLFEDVSHLHKLETQIKETFNDLSLASQLLGLHKFSQKKDGSIQLSNNDLLKELGFNENASRNLIDYVCPSEQQRILQLNESETCTLRIMNKTGEYQWWTVVCTSAIPGKLKGFTFSVQELTELQTKVKSTRDCFEIGSSTNAFAFWAINLDPSEPPHSVFTTKTYEYLLQNTHPDFHDVLALEKLKGIETPATLEVKLRLDTLINFIWFSLTLIPMGGRQLLCFAFNIDDRKKTHDLLRQTQQLLELAFTYSDAKMWAFEDRYDTVITSESDQLIMDWSTLQHNLAPEFHSKVCNAFKKALAGTDKLEIEVPFFFDSLHWLLMRGIRISDHKLVGICIDTTAIKEASQELEKQKAAAEEASMAKSIFLANMSHEIRTPLNGICGLLEILQSSELTPEQEELTNCIQNSFMELLELLNDTLDLAKLESHKVIPLSVKFDACDVLTSLQDTIFLRKKKPNFNFRIFTDAKAPILFKGDPHCFVRIVTNILSNSTKFTEKGSIDITLKELSNNNLPKEISIPPKAHVKFSNNNQQDNESNDNSNNTNNSEYKINDNKNISDNNDDKTIYKNEKIKKDKNITDYPLESGLLVEVSDSGLGISEQRLQNIQEHFQKGEMMAVYENTCVGVGLSLVTEMIRFMNGSISVTSEVGVGTKFSFVLPFEPVYYPIPIGKAHNSLLNILIYGVDKDVALMIQNFATFYGFNVDINNDSNFPQIIPRRQKDSLHINISNNNENNNKENNNNNINYEENQNKDFKENSDSISMDKYEYKDNRSNNTDNNTSSNCYTNSNSTDKNSINGKCYDILFTDHDFIITNVINMKIPKEVKIALLMSSEPKDNENNYEIFVKPLKPNLLREFFLKVCFGRETQPVFGRSPSFQSGSSNNILIRVLAVDDNSTNQLVIKKMLKKLGCSFEVVSNGREAVEIVQREKFDLVLMDQFMPILDGPQATQEIRKIGGNLANLPIIAMTASILQEDEEKCRKAGMNAFICKPVTLKNLSKILDQYCRCEKQ